MKKILIVLFFPSFLFIMCKGDAGTNSETTTTETSSKEAEQQKAWDDMMVIHDDVMPKMSDINSLQRDFKKYVDENKETLSPTNLEKISAAQMALQKADDGMMSWMNGLKQLPKLREELGHEAVMLYLQEQTKIITNVKEAMISSINQGKEMMAEMTAQ